MAPATRSRKRGEKAKIRQKAASKHSSSTSPKKKKTAPTTWNTMSHLSIKRFRDDDPSLTPGARRDRQARPYVALAEKDPSGRSVCKRCGERIEKGVLRMGLMMECHKGYRNLCTLHETCFWDHPETKKLVYGDLFIRRGVDGLENERIKKGFDTLIKKD